MPGDFFTFWVADLWGSSLLALFGTGALFAFIGILGRMSYSLLFALLMLYFMVFGVGFFGIIIWLPMFLFSMVYFGLKVYDFLQK